MALTVSWKIGACPHFSFLPFETKDAESLMAFDAELLKQGKSPDFPFTFHAYTWARPCITYGYLQKPEQLLDLDYLARIGAPVVRRPTGGKVAFHGHDLAYSLTCHAGNPPRRARELVSSWIVILAEALQRLGYPVVAGGERRADGWSQPLCGAERGPADILLDGRKLAGHAFRKAGPALQLQGTLAIVAPGPQVEALWKAFPPGSLDPDELACLPAGAPAPAALAAALAAALTARS